MLDRDQRVVCWNYWFASASGISSEEAVGKTLDELFPGRPLVRLTTSVSEALALGSSALLTYMLNRDLLPLRTRAGLPLIHNVSVRPFGEAALLALPAPDFRRHRRRASRSDPARAPERALRCRRRKRVGRHPDAGRGRLGPVRQFRIASRNELRARRIGRTSLDHLFEEPRRWQELWDKVLSGDASLRAVELVARRKDGSRTFLDVSASRWLSDGRVFVTAILRDITERHAAEEALHELNASLEQRVAERTQERDRIWQVSRDMLGVAAADGTWISVNPAWTKVLGWLPDEIRGKTSEWLEHPDDRRKMRDAVASLALPGTKRGVRKQLSDAARRIPHPVLDRGQRRRIALLRGSRRHGATPPAGCPGQGGGRSKTVPEDGSGRSADRRPCARFQQSADRHFRLLSNFCRSGYRQGRYKDVERYISTAQGAANRAAALDAPSAGLFAAADARSESDRRQSADWKHDGPHQQYPRSGNRDDHDHRSPDLWTTLVDPNQLENALLNLCINARDAMPDGGKLKIETANRTLDSAEAFSFEMRPGDYVCLSVTDTGTGMSDEVVQRAFDPFYTTKPLGQGTGLGLSMIYGFAKQSGGQVRISSLLGRGTTISSVSAPSLRAGSRLPSNSTDFSLGTARRSRRNRAHRR